MSDPHGLAYILPDDGPLIDFDLVVSESHTNSSTVTNHPVEKGVNISDHVKPEPISLSLEVWVTNSPGVPLDAYGGEYQSVKLFIPKQPPPSPFAVVSNLLDSATDTLFGKPSPPIIEALVYPSPFDKVEDTHIALTSLERAGGSVSVVTSTKRYPDMVISSIGYEKSEGGCGSFKIDFKQIKTVTSSTVAAPSPVEPRGATAKSKGSQAAKAVDGPDAPKVSVLKQIQDAAKKALGGL